MVAESTRLEELKGRAELSNDNEDSKIEVDFILRRSASGSYFVVHAGGEDASNWLSSVTSHDFPSALKGQLSDGRAIGCKYGGLSANNVFSISEEAEGTFLPLSNVLIGEEGNICFAMQVHLQGSLGVNLHVSLNDFDVKICSDVIDIEEKYLYSKDHLMFLAATTIRIESKQGTKEEFQTLYESISRMLCLGLARSISVQCHKFHFLDGAVLEQWHERTGYGVGAQSIVIESCLEEYLVECLAQYERLGENAQHKIHMASAYLTMSENGFADLQALQVIQAWELYARSQMESQDEEKNEDGWIEELVRDLKKYRKSALLKKYPKMKSNADVWDRIIKFVRRVSVSDPMTRLIEKSGLDTNKTGLDLQLLMSLANSVRHSGSMSSDKPIWELEQTISASRIALRLILLREIGYTGLVKFDNGEEFIKKDCILAFFRRAE